MIICVAGKNSIAIKTCQYILKKYTNVVLVGITNQTDTGENGFEPSFKSFLKLNNIEEVTLESLYNIEELVFISLEFDKIIRVDKFKSKRLFNIHFSFLPEFKGMYTSALPILYGKRYTGVTLHIIDNGIDTGDIIAQEKIIIKMSDTAKTLYGKYIAKGTKLVISQLEFLIKNSYTKKPQGSLNSTYYSKSSIDYGNLSIDFKKTAQQIIDQIRAFTFREYQLPEAFGFNISGASISVNRSIESPGKIVDIDYNKIFVSSIDFDVVLYKDFLDDFIDACAQGNLTEVLKIFPVITNINEKNKRGWNALMVSVYNNKIRIVEFLLLNRADIDVVNFNGTTILMYAKDAALHFKSTEIIKLVVRYGAKISSKDLFGKTVLDYALQQDENIYHFLKKIND
jgi:methionyl-tRNA formyltransferase